MRLIEYRGPHDAVDVPTFNLADVKANVPKEVPDHVAENLTQGGTSLTWFDVTPAAPKNILKGGGE